MATFAVLALLAAFQGFGAPSSFVNAPLPDNATLAGAPVNPAAPAELQRQAGAYGTYINAANWTAPLTVVPATQPLVPVRCAGCPWALTQMMLGISPTRTDLHGGLPISDTYQPATLGDTDAEAVFYQPDYVSPAGPRGRFYEAWKLRPDPTYDPARPVGPTNTRWTAASGGRVVGASTSRGHYVSWTASGYQFRQPGHPDSTYQDWYWGVLATGLFIASDEVRRDDCTAGRIDHAVGVVVHNAHPGHVWPAVRDDGTDPSLPLVEGMRLRFPPDMPKPVFSNRFAGMLFDAAQKYGLVVDDKTLSSVAVRVEPVTGGHAAPECWALLDGAHGYDALTRFPWSKLQVLATGSDATPTPTG